MKSDTEGSEVISRLKFQQEPEQEDKSGQVISFFNSPHITPSSPRPKENDIPALRTPSGSSRGRIGFLNTARESQEKKDIVEKQKKGTRNVL